MPNGYTNLLPTAVKSNNYSLNKSLDINSDRILLGDNAVTATISALGIQTTNINGLQMDCKLDMLEHIITNINSSEYYNGINVHDDFNNSIIGNTNSLILTGTDTYIKSNIGDIFIQSDNFINLTANNGIINIASLGGLSLQSTDDSINLSAANDIILNAPNVLSNINLTSGNKVNIISGLSGVKISSQNDYINFITSNSTYFNLTTELTGDGTIYTTNVNSPYDLILQTGGSSVAQINSGDNTQITCGENFLVQTNYTSGLVHLNTGNLENGGAVKWNNYPISMTFLNYWFGSFTYPSTPFGVNNWEGVNTQVISLPSQFLYGTYSVNFSINLYNNGSSPTSSGFAMYFNFFDTIHPDTVFNGLIYNENNPWAQYFNASTYNASPMCITYTDYFDFTANSINSLQIQLHWYDNIPKSENFKMLTTFTLVNKI